MQEEESSPEKIVFIANDPIIEKSSEHVVQNSTRQAAKNTAMRSNPKQKPMPTKQVTDLTKSMSPRKSLNKLLNPSENKTGDLFYQS